MQDHPPAQDRDTFDLPPADRTIEHVSFAIARELGEAGRLSDFCLESGRWFANGTLCNLLALGDAACMAHACDGGDHSIIRLFRA